MNCKINQKINISYTWIAVVVINASTTCFGLCGITSLETNPINPNASTPISTIINSVCSDTCFEPCEVNGVWISPNEFQIDWFFIDIDPCFGCSPIVTLHSSELNMGDLDPGDYTITTSLYIASPCETPCLDGELFDEMEQMITVGPPVPTVSVWGMFILALIILVASTLILRKHAIVIVCFGIFLFPNYALARSPDFSIPHHAEKMFVRFKPSVSKQSMQTVHTILGAQVIKQYRFVDNLFLVKVPAERLENAINQYLDREEILYAELDHFMEPNIIPNDPKYVSQWNMDCILAPYAWDLWTGDSNFRVAVIDVGIFLSNPHTDLLSNLWVNPLECPGGWGTCVANSIDEDLNGYDDDFYGYDFAGNFGNGDNNPDPEQDNFHGTAVAGIVGAATYNNNGIAGINWSCDVVALKIADDDGHLIMDAAVDAMEYVIANNIKVSNNSYGKSYNQCLYDMIEASQSIGHIFVAASGNSSNNNDKNPNYPSDYALPNIISVAAMDSDDCLAAFQTGDGSNFGRNNVDLGAPGKSVITTSHTPSSYDLVSGTSISSPHVAGVVALIMSQNPTMPWQDVKERVLSTVTPLASLRGLTVTGGLLNASGAMGDCNINGVQDDLDISGGTSTDCNSNAVPDECEINEDCQPNGIQDICDIAIGTSEDCNGNDYPDECELDGCGTPLPTICASGDCCTSNGTRGCDCALCYHAVSKIFTYCQRNSTWSSFCSDKASRFPVCACDPSVTTPRNDCNDNGVIDACDIMAGTSNDVIGVFNLSPDTPGSDEIPDECQNDCNCNFFPDWWDILRGISQDANTNDIPDECEAIDGACCFADSACVLTTSCSCDVQGGYFNGVSSSCTSLGAKGACCTGSDCDDQVKECVCNAMSGTFLGESTACLDPPDNEGACCIGSSCSIKSDCDCIDAGGNFQGYGSQCLFFTCQQYGPQGP